MRQSCSRLISQVSLAAAMCCMLSVPARAQQQVTSEFVLAGQRLVVSSREMQLLSAVRNVFQKGAAVQDAALAAARRGATGRDARYVLALYQLEIGGLRKDDRLRAEGLDGLIASGLAPPLKLANYLEARGGIAYRLRDFATARTLWTRLLALTPDDPGRLANLAQVYQAEQNSGGAADLLQRAIVARKATGQPAPEVWYRQWLSVANQGKLTPSGTAAAHELVRYYPTPTNWRDALVVYRQLNTANGDVEIDLLRLMRTVGAFARATEYQRLAQLLSGAGLGAEARAVLDDGLARDVLDVGDATTRAILAEADRAAVAERAQVASFGRLNLASAASTAPLRAADSLYGAGRSDDAIALYRAALTSPAVDAYKAHVRIGMVLALADRRVDADKAFRSVSAKASGPPGMAGYADLAGFWLAWVTQQPAEH